jgi:asparagine synthase (glutamine-hydrolysing)
MCGISGYIGKNSIEESRISQTLHLMKNRGPDYSDYISIKNGETNIVLLHSRLSIIDLNERGNQPFTIGECTLIFNGEIYNYIELRKRLEKKGVKFKTTSDTEVLLQSYLDRGEACVNDFEGMWSFAIYDRRKRKLFFSRDRFAEKPLYYLETSDGVFFGSEIKFIKSLSGIKPTVNMQHIFRYLVNGYKSLYKTNETFFNGIKEIPYATNLVIENNLTLKTNRYWKPVCAPKNMTLSEAIEGFRGHLLESIKIRLRSDVPMAFCLSGGVDSSAIVSIAAKCFNYDVAAFSIVDSDERYNELDNIQATLRDLECKNTVINISKEGFFKKLQGLIEYHDAPIYTISYYIHSFLSESISKQGYKVACSGIAADEMVTGYYDHFNFHLYEMRHHPEYKRCLDDWKKHIGGIVRNPYLKDPELCFNKPDFRGHLYLDSDVFAGFLKKEFKEEFKEINYCDSLLRNRMMNEMFQESIPMILHEDDLNSMYYSIENRSPYLDSKLFDFAYSIPSEYLIRDGYGKYILRESVKGILNEKVRTDRQKKGFNASIHSLFDFDNKKNWAYLLNDSLIYNFVKKEKIEEIFSTKPMSNSYSKFIFNFINAKIFLEMNR